MAAITVFLWNQRKRKLGENIIVSCFIHKVRHWRGRIFLLTTAMSWGLLWRQGHCCIARAVTSESKSADEERSHRWWDHGYPNWTNPTSHRIVFLFQTSIQLSMTKMWPLFYPFNVNWADSGWIWDEFSVTDGKLVLKIHLKRLGSRRIKSDELPI